MKMILQSKLRALFKTFRSVRFFLVPRPDVGPNHLSASQGCNGAHRFCAKENNTKQVGFFFSIFKKFLCIYLHRLPVESFSLFKYYYKEEFIVEILSVVGNSP